MSRLAATNLRNSRRANSEMRSATGGILRPPVVGLKNKIGDGFLADPRRSTKDRRIEE
jgi:hypothetical protein